MFISSEKVIDCSFYVHSLKLRFKKYNTGIKIITLKL